MATKREGRTTVYNAIVTPEELERVNPQNIALEEDFLAYLEAVDRSPGTIRQYKYNLHIFWIWNLELNANKYFVELTKREVAKFQSYAISAWGWSPKRIRTVKATLSSLSNYIENMLDDEYPDYRPIINKIESPPDEKVRTKVVLTKDELDDVLDKLVERKKYEAACFLSLGMNSGRRKSELLRFKVSYFDEKNLICGGSLYKTPEQIETKGRGKRGKLLYVYTLAKQFKPYFDLWMRQREAFGVKSDYLFPRYSANSNRWFNQPAPVSQADSWGNLIERLLGRPFYIHALRNYFTTELYNSGIPEGVIKDIIGWENVDMVNLYLNVDVSDELEKYFGEDGIKHVEKKGFGDM